MLGVRYTTTVYSVYSWECDITVDRSSTPGSSNSWKEAPGNHAACSSRMLTHRYTRYQRLMQGILHSLSFHAFYEPMKLQVFIRIFHSSLMLGGTFWMAFVSRLHKHPLIRAQSATACRSVHALGSKKEDKEGRIMSYHIFDLDCWHRWEFHRFCKGTSSIPYFVIFCVENTSPASLTCHDLSNPVILAVNVYFRCRCAEAFAFPPLCALRRAVSPSRWNLRTWL